LSFLAAVLIAATAEPATYADLLRAYAAGDRAAAVAELARFDDAPIARELDALRDRAGAVARCSTCDPTEVQAALRAAVMLHTDRDDLERRPLTFAGERAPSCGPPVHALFAERALVALLSDARGRDFARRWYLARGLRSLGDLCFEEGRQWTASGLKRFARDKELLLTRGLLAEAAVTVAQLRAPALAGVTPRELEFLRQQQLESHSLLTEATGSYEQVLATDPAFEEASLHLGRVRYRLGQHAPALKALEPIFAGGRERDWLYLAHLFAGRVHEAAGRAGDAERAYANAAGIDPDGQAAAMALAHLRLMAGDTAQTRAILDEELGRSVPRSHDDPFWDYLLGAARRAEPLLEALRDEATAR
jgi:tetratricopeptide (TPR) repeat protein